MTALDTGGSPQSGAAPVSAPADGIGANPFPGLRPFNEDEEHLFFGRERQVDAMIDKLAATHFLAVVGTSGSGKSSLVNCGLRPALHRGLMGSAGPRWRVAQFRPGAHPVLALARALVQALPGHDDGPGPFSATDFVETTLRLSQLGLVDAVAQSGLPPDTQLLVVADQFEELFRYAGVNDAGVASSATRDEATAFVNLLLNAAAQRELPIYVVLTMRADFLGDCAQFFGLPEAINGGQYLVPRLTRDERRLAIAGPVGVGGAQIDPLLLTRLVNDVGDNPDQLSILQHALNRTWTRWAATRRPGEPIALADYEGIGTMAAALDQHAEEAFAELATAPRQALCERMFKALTDRSTDPRGVRRPTRLDTLCAITAAPEAAVREVIEAFRQPGRAFLMPPAGEALAADSVIDISHESLMRVWARLRDWAATETESVGTYLRLVDSADRHVRHGENLLWEPALPLVLAWRDTQQPNAAWAAQYRPGFAEAMRFLDASEAARVERVEAEKRRKRRQRAGVIAVTALVLGVVGLGLFNLSQRRETDALREAGQAAEARQWASQSHEQLLSGRIDLALLYAMQARRIKHVPDAQDALLAALRVAPHRVLSGHEYVVSGLAFSPDSRSLASASDDGAVLLWNVADGSLRGQLAVNRKPSDPGSGRVTVQEVAYGPDARRVVVLNQVNDAGTVWEPASGSLRRTADESSEPSGSAAALDAAHGLSATAGVNGLSLWDLATGLRRVLVPLAGVDDQDGFFAATSLAISSDGERVAVALSTGDIVLVRVKDAAAPEQAMRLKGYGKALDAVAFTPDGSMIASASLDGRVQLWQVADGKLVAEEAGFIDEMVKDRTPARLIFSADGKSLAWAGGSNGALVTWDMPGLNGRQTVQAHQGPIQRIAFAPDGASLASAGSDGVVRLWALKPKMQTIGQPLRGHAEPVNALAFSADGHWLASAADKLVMLWDVSGTRPWRGPLRDSLQSINCVAFSADGKTIASGNEEGDIKLWNVLRGAPEPVQLPNGHTESVEAVAFGGEGRWLASAGRDGRVMLWDVENRLPIATLTGHSQFVTSVAFRPKGDLVLASGDGKGKVILWDVQGTRTKELTEFTKASGVWSLAFNPEGDTLAVAGKKVTGKDQVIDLWDVSRPAAPVLLRKLTGGHTDDVTSVSFSADGKTLASGSLDSTVLVWDVASGRQRQVAPMQHAKGIWSVAFMHSGSTLASASLDATARLWNADTGQALAEPLNGRNGRVWSASFSPDDRTLATVSINNTMMLWDTHWSSWEQRACRIVNLRDGEVRVPPDAVPLTDLRLCPPPTTAAASATAGTAALRRPPTEETQR